MADRAVSIAFLAKDKVSVVLDRLGNKSMTAGKRIKAGIERANASFAKLSAMGRGGGVFGGVLGGMVVSRGIFEMASGVRTVTEEFVGLDGALTSAAAKFGGIARGSKEFEALEAAARSVGATTQFTSREAGEGLEFLAMAGFNAQQSVAALPPLVDLATASNMDLARASDIASDALGAFKLMSKDSAVLTGNMTRINDVFAATVTSANVDMENLFETMKDGGPVLTTAGQSLETFAALTGVMGSAGIKGSKAGTTLKNMTLKLTSATGKGAATLRRLGISVKDSSGNMRDMLDILDDLSAATSKMGNVERSAALDTIFGKRAIAGLGVVLDGGVDKVRDFRDQLNGAAGASKKMAADMRKSLGNRLKILKSGLIDIGFKFIEAFQEKFPGAINSAIEAVQGFDVAPIVDGVKTFIDYVKIGKDIFVEWWPVIGAITSAFMALRIATLAAAAAQVVLNFITALNPFMLLIMAIGAAVFALWYYWDEIQIWAEGVVGAFFDMTDSIAVTMGEVAVGIRNFFVNIFNNAMDLAADMMKGIVDLLAKTPLIGKKESIVLRASVDAAVDRQKYDWLEAPTKEKIRRERMGGMGLPFQSYDDERSQLDRNTREIKGRGGRAGQFEAMIDPQKLQGMMQQTTDVNLDVGFKGFPDWMQDMMSVQSTATSSNPNAQTKVNRSRAGAN